VPAASRTTLVCDRASNSSNMVSFPFAFVGVRLKRLVVTSSVRQ
jgi:hypothetical protein